MVCITVLYESYRTVTQLIGQIHELLEAGMSLAAYKLLSIVVCVKFIYGKLQKQDTSFDHVRSIVNC